MVLDESTKKSGRRGQPEARPIRGGIGVRTWGVGAEPKEGAERGSGLTLHHRRTAYAKIMGVGSAVSRERAS